MSRLADALDEARRGLWRSALESFDAAYAERPDDPGPALAAVVCLLERGAVDAALIRLEAGAALSDVTGEYRLRRDWLSVAARLRADDVLAAERGCARLPSKWAGRARAVVALSHGDYAAGVAHLLRGMRPPNAQIDSR